MHFLYVNDADNKLSSHLDLSLDRRTAEEHNGVALQLADVLKNLPVNFALNPKRDQLKLLHSDIQNRLPIAFETSGFLHKYFKDAPDADLQRLVRVYLSEHCKKGKAFIDRCYKEKKEIALEFGEIGWNGLTSVIVEQAIDGCALALTARYQAAAILMYKFVVEKGASRARPEFNNLIKELESLNDNIDKIHRSQIKYSALEANQTMVDLMSMPRLPAQDVKTEISSKPIHQIHSKL